MKTVIRVCICCVLLVAVAVHANTETVILKVYVNRVDRGDYFFHITADGRLSIGREQLLNMGLQRLPAAMTDGVTGIALDDLPRVQHRLDMAQSMLHIEAHPDLLAHHVVNLGRQRTEVAMLLRDTTAYLNYNIRYDEFGSLASNQRYSVPLELGLSSGTVALSSSGSYSRSTTGSPRWQRHASRLIWDDPGRLNRWVVGDFTTFSGLLGGGGAYAGLRLSRRFSLQPQVRRGPGLDLTGMLWAPSELEVYVDERLVRRERLPPGQFTLNDVPTYSGVGQATVVIKDIMGRESRIVTDFYRSAQLLAPGLHDYNHSIGFPRRRTTLNGNQYAAQPVYLGFHQWGVTRALTVGMRTEVGAAMINAGPTAAFVAGPLGEVELALALSGTPGDRGAAGHVAHFYRGAGFNTRFSLRATSRRYAYLGLTPQQDRATLQGLFGFGYYHAKLGSITLTYNQTRRYLAPVVASYRLSFARRTFARSFVSASLLYNDGPGARYSVDLRLTLPLGRRHHVSADRRVTENQETDTVSLRQQLPVGNGLAYDAWYQRRRDPLSVDDNARLGLRYQAPAGLYTATRERDATLSRSTLSAAGSFTYVGGVLRPSRTVRDGFALVKVGRLQGVRVYHQHQLVGRTDKRGEILVPNLISYQNNLLSIEDKDIPINYALANTKIFAAPVTKGGGVVEFDITRLQGFVGYIYFDNGLGPQPLESVPLRVDNGKRVIDTIIGFGGEFYLENLQPGDYQLTVALTSGQCAALLTIPDSEQMMVDLGEVHCQILE